MMTSPSGQSTTGTIRASRCAALALAAAVVTLAPALGPAKSEAADTVCNPNGKVANLNFTLKDMDGRDVTLSAFKGQVILLDFWATWCGPCKVEIPGFVELYRTYRPQGFVVLGVSVDDPVSKLKPFAARLKMNYPILIGDGRDDVKDAFGPLIGFPTSLLIGRDGRVCTSHTGLKLKEQFEREIKSLL
jgi:peroxiredoxin